MDIETERRAVAADVVRAKIAALEASIADLRAELAELEPATAPKPTKKKS